MLSFEKILEVFRNYLLIDSDVETVMTSHGYTVMCWDSIGGDWLDAQYCKTPQDLLDVLLECYRSYLSDLITESKRELTKQEKKEIKENILSMKQKCYAEIDSHNMQVMGFRNIVNKKSMKPVATIDD